MIASETIALHRATWSPGSRPPKGCDPGELLNEYDRIKNEYGTASTSVIKGALRSNPRLFPNFMSWLPKSDEEAWDIAIEEAVRRACQSVAWVRVLKKPDGSEEQSEPVRVLYSIANPKTGTRSYERLDLIVQNKSRKLSLLEDLNREADTFATKLRRVLNEIHELHVLEDEVA